MVGNIAHWIMTPVSKQDCLSSTLGPTRRSRETVFYLSFSDLYRYTVTNSSPPIYMKKWIKCNNKQKGLEWLERWLYYSMYAVRLKHQLCSSEYILLCQRTQVQFPVPTHGSLYSHLMPASEDLRFLLVSTDTHTLWHNTYIHKQTYACIK